MITKEDFISLYDFQDLTIQDIRKLKPIFADGFEAFKNLHYIDDDEMEGEFNGIFIRAKKFKNKWCLCDNKGGYLECDISAEKKIFHYLEKTYHLTKDEYFKEVKEIEATYRILSRLR